MSQDCLGSKVMQANCSPEPSSSVRSFLSEVPLTLDRDLKSRQSAAPKSMTSLAHRLPIVWKPQIGSRTGNRKTMKGLQENLTFDST